MDYGHYDGIGHSPVDRPLWLLGGLILLRVDVHVCHECHHCAKLSFGEFAATALTLSAYSEN